MVDRANRLRANDVAAQVKQITGLEMSKPLRAVQVLWFMIKNGKHVGVADAYAQIIAPGGAHESPETNALHEETKQKTIRLFRDFFAIIDNNNVGAFHDFLSATRSSGSDWQCAYRDTHMVAQKFLQRLQSLRQAFADPENEIAAPRDVRPLERDSFTEALAVLNDFIVEASVLCNGFQPRRLQSVMGR